MSMFYLGATAAEMANFFDSSQKPAFMACHFSPASSGISNIPLALPPESLLLLDDETPPSGHDAARVIRELSRAAKDLGCSGVYLDFQREGYPILGEIAAMAEDFPCPIAVSKLYSGGNRLAVVLPPLPVDVSLAAYIAPWKGREIWMEAALGKVTLTLTKEGCREEPLLTVPEQGLREERLCCHYTVSRREDAAVFRLWRTYEDLLDLAQKGEALGIKHTLGLYQEIAPYFGKR